MNYRLIGRLLSTVLLIVAAFLLPAMGIALFLGETASLIAFAVTFGVMVALALPLRAFKPTRKHMFAREGFVLTAVCWILLSVLGAMPFVISGAIPFWVDALFETVSGFSTTGATILSDVESLPRAMLYWRSFTHWLGGMGVLVFLLAIVPTGSGEALFIMRAESPGPSVGKLVSRLRDSARILYTLYIALTVIMYVALRLTGLAVFDSVILSLGTAGTGGFGIRNDSLASYAPAVQWVTAVFMMLFGINFTIYYLLTLRQVRKALWNEELRLYLIVILAVTGLCAASIWNQCATVEEALRHSFFSVCSVLTSTGFATADFNLWPQVCRMALVLLMIMGACAGSTGGGVKVSRVLILFKSLRIEIRRMLHPNLVAHVRLDDESVPEETVTGVSTFLAAYAAIAIVSMLLLSLDGHSFETNTTAVISCLSNIGPGLDMVGPMGNYAGFSPLAKLLLAFDMLVGRLEIFPVLILFVPRVWKTARRG